MRIKGLRGIRSLLQGAAPAVEITIRIDLTLVKRLSEILVAELAKLGIKIEVDDCMEIINKMLDEYMQKSDDQDSKD